MTAPLRRERQRGSERGPWADVAWKEMWFTALTSRGEGWSIHLYLPRDNCSLDHGCFIPTLHPDLTGEHKPEHALEGGLGVRMWGSRLKREEKGAGAKHKGCLPSRVLLAMVCTDNPECLFQGGSISCDNPIPPWTSI